MKKILFTLWICIIPTSWISAQQTNNLLTLETKKTDTVRVDLSEYYYIIVFDEYFCKACYKNLSDEKILMIYNKKGLDKIDRISLYNSIKKIYKSADIYFVCTTLPKDFKINRITKYDNGKQKISLSKIY